MKKTLRVFMFVALMLCTLCVSALAFSTEEEKLFNRAEVWGMLDYLEITDMDNNITRLELTKLLVAARGWGPEDAKGNYIFSDCAHLTADEQAIIDVACTQGIMSSYSNEDFAPNSLITRAAMAKIIYDAWRPWVKEIDEAFSDISSDYWAYESIVSLYNIGNIPNSVDGCFHPTEAATVCDALLWILGSDEAGVAMPSEIQYYLTMQLYGGELWLYLFVPNTVDPHGEYNIFWYDSEKPDGWHMKSNIQANQSKRMLLADRAYTFDAIQIISRSTGEIVASRKLGKPIFTSIDLPTPENVTITRYPESNEKDCYIFTGLNLGEYKYNIFSLDGSRGNMIYSEVQSMDAGFFDTQVLLYIHWVKEDNDAFYINTNNPDVAIITITDLDKILDKDESTVSGTVTGGSGASIEINGESVQVNEDGSFEIPAEGTFDVVVKKGGCLTYTIKGVTTESGSVELPEMALVAGDVTGDDKINIQDMGVFRQNFGKAGSDIGNVYTDVNEDGKVNIQDMGVFRQNFGKTAEKDCTVNY